MKPGRLLTTLPEQRFLAQGDPACRRKGVDPEWFFPPQGQTYDRARSVCMACPLRQACAEWAVTAFPVSQMFGMFGGLTPDELSDRRRWRYGTQRTRPTGDADASR